MRRLASGDGPPPPRQERGRCRRWPTRSVPGPPGPPAPTAPAVGAAPALRRDRPVRRHPRQPHARGADRRGLRQRERRIALCGITNRRVILLDTAFPGGRAALISAPYSRITTVAYVSTEDENDLLPDGRDPDRPDVLRGDVPRRAAGRGDPRPHHLAPHRLRAGTPSGTPAAGRRAPRRPRGDAAVARGADDVGEQARPGAHHRVDLAAHQLADAGGDPRCWGRPWGPAACGPRRGCRRRRARARRAAGAPRGRGRPPRAGSRRSPRPEYATPRCVRTTAIDVRLSDTVGRRQRLRPGSRQRRWRAAPARPAAR